MTRCCGETGALGIALLIIALVVSFIFAVLCIAGALFMFLAKRNNEKYVLAIRLIYLIGLLIAGIITIVAVILAAFFALNVELALACFGAIFIIELIVLIVLAVAFFIAWKKGDYLNVNLVALVVCPIGMAFCVIAIIILLIERENLGNTALTVIAIIALCLEFVFFVALCISIGWLIFHNIRGEKAVTTWVAIGALVVAAVVQICGVILAAFFDLSLLVGSIGFLLCLAVTLSMTLYFLIYWFILARTSESLAYKWTIFILACVCGFFVAVALIGLLTMGGKFILR